jgi:hypothetical protein
MSFKPTQMEIRFLADIDAGQISKIHRDYFSDMEFPNFYNKYHCVYVVVTPENSIICVGGLRPVAEAVVLTNKNFSVRDRRDALLKIFEAVNYSAEKLSYDQIHAFSFDRDYTNHLIMRMGFKCNEENKVLTLDVKNGQEERTGSST